jgi:hypothetical protein
VDGESYSVTFPYNGNKTLTMKLCSVIPALPGDGAVLVFECGTIPENFDFTRMQPVQIGTVEYRGFRVPVSAVRILDGYEGVYILDQVTVQFRRIQIVYEGDGYYISKTDYGEGDTERHLREHDRIILGGKELYDGRTVG